MSRPLMLRRMRERTPVGRIEEGSGSIASGPLLDRARPRAYAAAVEKGRPVWFSPALPRFRPAVGLTGAQSALAPRRRACALPCRRYEGTWIMQQQVSVITVAIGDIARSKRFYVDGFGWTPVFETPEIVFYQMNGLMLGTWLGPALETDMQRPGLARPGAFSLAHNVLAQREVQPLLDRLAAHGGRLFRTADAPPHGGLRGYVREPDGHARETAYNPAGPSASNRRGTVRR